MAWTIGVAAAGLFFVWGAICRFRMGVQVSGQKLTIGNELRTHIIDVSDIRAITLKPKQISQVATHWKPWVELTSGQGVWIYNFDCGPAGRPPREWSARRAVQRFPARASRMACMGGMALSLMVIRSEWIRQ